MKKYIPLVSIFVVAAILGQMCSSCATNPVTGEQELMLMTESQEIAMGAETHQAILATYGEYDDPGLKAYITAMGEEMAAISHRPHLNWTFTVLDSPVINAFAVPGGYVYVTRGLLAHMNNEAELAMVIGHEIGHVTARHSARQYSKQLLLTGGLILGSVLSEDFADYAPLAGVGLQLLFLKYSRDHERQSDDLGVEYAYAAGYNPDEFDDFFRVLNRMETTAGGGGLPGFLSTHPMTENRIQDVTTLANAAMAANPPAGRQLRTNTEQLLRQIDGMVVGDDPRQGYVEGNAFYHPEMNFQFNVPTGWKIQNTPQMVQMASSDEKALIIFQLAKESTPRQAWESVVAENDLATVDQPGVVSVNGLDAYAGVCRYTDGDTTLGIQLLTVKKDSQVFTFIGLAEARDFNRYQSTIVSSLGSFNQVQDRAKLAVQPKRLSIQRINRAIGVGTFLSSLGVSDKEIQQLLIMNSLESNGQLRNGDLIKSIR